MLLIMNKIFFSEFATSIFTQWQKQRHRCHFTLHRKSRKIHLYIRNGLFSLDYLYSESKVSISVRLLILYYKVILFYFIRFQFHSSFFSRYWPVIDNALRAAAIERKVTIKLLISLWKHSRVSESYFLRSLEKLTNSYRNVKIEIVSILVLW